MPSSTLKIKFKTFEELTKAFEEIKNSNSYLESTLNKRVSWGCKGPLSGYVCAIKDLISSTDNKVTGGSKFLVDYAPPFNASVYRAIMEAGAFNIAHANLDEFGLGGCGLFSSFGIVANAVNEDRIIGGSSSGSVYLISKGLINFSLASDTGDSARYPASLVGVIGFKPSYGLVSRYGFYPFCSSFDTPSICADSVETAAKVLSVISFPDPHDLCTLKTEKKDYFKDLNVPVLEKIKVAILNDTFWSSNPLITETSQEIKREFDGLKNLLNNEFSWEIGNWDFSNPDLLRLCSLIYAVVAYSESNSNYSNLTGLLFPFYEKNGKFEPINAKKGNNYHQILSNNRSVFGREFTIRQLLGKHFLEGENYEKVYLHSKKVLSLIQKEVNRLFESYDLVISPTTLDVPPRIEDWKRNYSPRNDTNILLLANFCALPAISIPWIKVDGMPIGLHLMSRKFSDSFLLRISHKLFSYLNKE